ncbi:MAG: sensor histidine kinase [Bacteroidales bacterium]
MKNSRKYKKFGLRLLAVFCIQLIIKHFDQSFTTIFSCGIRSLYFAFIFLFIWLSSWYLVDWWNKKHSNSNQLLKLLCYFFIGLISAWIHSLLYRYGDILLFKKAYIWDEIPWYHPEFIVGLMLFFLTGCLINEYFASDLKMKEKQLEAERLAKENVFAQYRSLKAQIEPHFLFNSLSVLSSIVYTDSQLASEFIIKLSGLLRYILEKNDRVLVSLDEEVKMASDYFFLIKTRFGESVYLDFNLKQVGIPKIYLPPGSLQELISNALKHNSFSNEKPLRIYITLDKERILVENNIQERVLLADSTGTGLNNLKKRYKLISGKEVSVVKVKDCFRVYLPFLYISHYESINYRG